MGDHKYHKVYSDHPIIDTDAKGQSKGMIQSIGQLFSRFSSWFSQHGLNFITLVVLILTWLAYLRANELNVEEITAANTPWVDVHLDNVAYVPNHPINEDLDDLPPQNGIVGTGPMNGPINNSAVDVRYTLDDHSPTPAKNVLALCFFSKAPEYSDSPDASSGPTLMPEQRLSLVSRMFTLGAKDPKEALDRLDRDKIGIEIYVSYSDVLKHRHSFIQTFYKLNGVFVLTNTELDPPENEIMDMIGGKDTDLEHRHL